MAEDAGKGKEKAIDLTKDKISEEEYSDSTTFSASSDSDSDSDSEDETRPKVTQEYLDSLLEKARKNAEAAERLLHSSGEHTEEVLTLDNDTPTPLPKLDPGNLPSAYIQLGATWLDGPSSIRDPGIERAEKATASFFAPAPPIPPAESIKEGKPLTKKQKKELRNSTAGPDWFDLPAPSEADLPRVYREVEALRLRNQLDPKRFYKRDEGEGKGIKGLPKYLAIGSIVPTTTPFGTASNDNLTRAERKRTLVEELVNDAEAKRYAKRKFEELQTVHGARGKNTLRAKQRKPKW